MCLSHLRYTDRPQVLVREQRQLSGGVAAVDDDGLLPSGSVPEIARVRFDALQQLLAFAVLRCRRLSTVINGRGVEEVGALGRRDARGRREVTLPGNPPLQIVDQRNDTKRRNSGRRMSKMKTFNATDAVTLCPHIVLRSRGGILQLHLYLYLSLPLLSTTRQNSSPYSPFTSRRLTHCSP